MTAFKCRFALLGIVLAGGCAPYPLQTDYSGGAVGKIQSRTERGGGPTAFGPDGKPYVAPVPVGGVVIPVESGGLPGSRSYIYEIRAADGTLHIVGSRATFEIGSCVAFSGYADGPSRTHWSVGRVTLERSTNCDK